MMKAIKNFMNKPWTWGTYFKLCGVVTAVYAAITFAVMKYDMIKAKIILKESNLEENEF